MKKVLFVIILYTALFFTNANMVFAADTLATCVYKSNNNMSLKINILSDYKFNIESDAISKYFSGDIASSENVRIEISYVDFMNTETKKIDCNMIDKLFLTFDAKQSQGRSNIIFTLRKEKNELRYETEYTLDSGESKIIVDGNPDQQDAKENSWLKVCHYNSYTLSFNETDYSTNFDFYIDGRNNKKSLMKFLADNSFSCPMAICPVTTGLNTYSSNLFYISNNLDLGNCIVGTQYTGEYICGILDKYMSEYDIITKMPESSEKSISKKQTAEKIKTVCNSMLQKLNYDGPDNCVKECLKVSETIGDFKVNDNNCGFSDSLGSFIINIFKWIKYILPVIVIILGIIDFIKAIAGDKDDEMKKAQKRFITRLIAAALAFLVPLLITFILEKMGFVPENCGLW